MTIVLYGIPNCDTVKKARVWLAENSIPFEFHDYKKAGVPADRLANWVEVAGWETILNRAGTTFKKLPDTDKTDLTAEKAIAIMVANPSAIKRPIAEGAGPLLVGFKPEEWSVIL